GPVRLMVFFAALLLAVGTTPAAPVHYDETTDGDLAAGGSLPVHALDVGVNTFVGTIATLPQVDADSFSFSIAPGLRLTSLTVNLTDGNLDFIFGSWTLCSGSNNFSTCTSVLDFVKPSSPGSDAIDTVPLGPDVYVMLNGSLSGAENSTGNYRF